MASSLRALKARILGHNRDMDKTQAELLAASVPVSPETCRICPDPCDEGHDEWPRKFDIDLETQMLGNVKPYRRQVVISTGKSDWDREVTDTSGSLAHFLSQVSHDAPKAAKTDSTRDLLPPVAPSSVPGVFASSTASRVSVLNGSHRTVCDDDAEQSVLVLPDYKVVLGVKESLDGARSLWKEALDPSLGRAGAGSGEDGLKSWILPYACVILLCSHKQRDNKCAIAAPKLETALTRSLESHNYEVHTQLEDPSCFPFAALEQLDGTPDEQDAAIRQQLREAAAAHPGAPKRALILKNSHIGGHKFAGNVIIYTPQGACVWYGRVSTHEVESVVLQTIVAGKVLAPLLRGGANIARPGCQTLHDW